MPSGAAEADEPALLLLQQGLDLLQPGALDPPAMEQEEGGGEAQLREDEDEDAEDEALLLPSPLLSALLPPGLDAAEGAAGARGMMAEMLSHACGGAPAMGGEQAALLHRRSVNTTECVPVPSSEHVAEIVGRQGCRIKALRARTNTYIKTPVRGEEPVFVVTGRGADVAAAKREILAAAEHFSLLRAWQGRAGPCRAAPGHTTARVRVPYRLVGLVVGPRGATVKRIQRQTRTYIVTPARRQEPVFEVTGAPENVDRARREIEAHIALRAGAFPELGGGFQGGRARRSDGSSSPGSGSTDSCLGGGPTAEFGPASPFGAGGFCFGDEPAPDSPVCDPLLALSPTVWAPPEPAFSGPECRRGCVLCSEGEAAAALLPCGHCCFCPRCADGICGGAAPACPVCWSAVARAVRIRS